MFSTWCGGVGAVAADLGRGLHAEDRRAVLGSADVGGHAGGAEADHDHVIVPELDNGVALRAVDVPLVGIAAVGVNDLGDNGLGRIGGDSRAGDVVDTQALRLDDAREEEVLDRIVDRVVLVLVGLGRRTGADGLDPGDGVALEGDGKLHLLHDAEGRGLGVVGAVGHGGLLAALGAGSLGESLLHGDADGVAGDGCAGDAVDVGALREYLRDELLVVRGTDARRLAGGVELHVGDAVLVHRQGDDDRTHAGSLSGIGAGRVGALGRGGRAHGRHQHDQAEQHG